MKKHYYLILLLGLLIIYLPDLKSQDNYVVTGSAINIRDGAGVEYNSIGKLNVGDEVLVFEIKGDWAKIRISDKDGYINKNYLQLKNKTVTNSTKFEDLLANVWLWIIVVSVIFIWITIIRYNKKCDKCKRWNSMKVYWREKVDEKQSHIRKSDTVTDVKGNKHTNYYSVPATIYYYHIHRKCKNCGYRDYVKKSDKVEN